MKDLINLLPPSVKKARVRRVYGARIAAIYITLIAAIVTIGAGYGGAYWVLRMSVANINDLLASGEASETSSQTRAVNARAVFIHQRLTSHPAFVPDVAAVLQAAPSGVVITKITTETEDQTILISGQSADRSSIVQYEARLREEDWIESIDAPLQNFASGPNVSFEFTIQRTL